MSKHCCSCRVCSTDLPLLTDIVQVVFPVVISIQLAALRDFTADYINGRGVCVCVCTLKLRGKNPPYFQDSAHPKTSKENKRTKGRVHSGLVSEESRTISSPPICSMEERCYKCDWNPNSLLANGLRSKGFQKSLYMDPHRHPSVILSK